MKVEVIRDGKAFYTGAYRYRPEIEMQMLESGYTVKVDGKRVTVSEARKRIQAVAGDRERHRSGGGKRE